MKQLFTLLLITFICISSLTAQAQEVVRKTSYKNGIAEKYLVLKKDKSIRHGQYILTYNDYWFKDYLMEVGQFDNNQKSGTWISFYHRNPSNFVKSVGDYKGGKKEGTWTYYHEYNPRIVTTMVGGDKKTRIHAPKKGTTDYQIEIDTADNRVASTGMYVNDQKVGVWEYYSTSGQLVNSYDHSAGKLVVDNLERLENSFMTYLGGIDRFVSSFYTAHREYPLTKPVTQATEVVFEMEKNGVFRYVNGSGNDQFNEHVAAILQTIPKDWIYLDETETGKLQVTCKTEGKNDFTIYLKSID